MIATRQLSTAAPSPSGESPGLRVYGAGVAGAAGEHRASSRRPAFRAGARLPFHRRAPVHLNPGLVALWFPLAVPRSRLRSLRPIFRPQKLYQVHIPGKVGGVDHQSHLLCHRRNLQRRKAAHQHGRLAMWQKSAQPQLQLGTDAGRRSGARRAFRFYQNSSLQQES